ncbi:MAG: 1-acyl-sn-glycerol-3-phosphate acyltransferase [Polaromonas sp.]|nr:1-acyl-sn-glycerol-3-phosphate acyltransferase [Polaromonas sp.]
MRLVRLGYRLLRAFFHTLAGFWIIRSRFHRLSVEEQGQHVNIWARKMLAISGVELVLKGEPLATGPVLLVANHISWLDILVMHSAGYCRFVSKADVKRWPLVGTMAAGAGTLFIERESRRDAHRVLHHMVANLHDGQVLAVFPEGTTSDGLSLLPFHANLIQAAITANAPVQAMALRFIDRRTGLVSQAPSFVGDDTLLGSMWRTLTARALIAQVTVGAPELARGRDRRTWAGDLQREVQRLRDAE